MGQSASLTIAAALLIARPAHFAVATTDTARVSRDLANETQEPKGKEPRRDPGPRAPIAGISGFDSLSKVQFAASPEVVHELKVTCSFPERMRWMMSAQLGGSLVRELQYQYGDAVYRIPTGTGASQVCEGEARKEILQRMQLRRALMLYPDGFEWKGDGVERTTEMGPLGYLRARVSADSGGRPSAIECVDAAGRTNEGYRVVTWRESAGRRWPATMEFWHGEERIWAETVESVDASSRFVDSFFVPPDLREGSTTRPVGGGIRTLDIPEICVLRTAIAAGTSWEAALREYESLRASRSKHLDGSGLKLEGIATFEVSEKGEPIASILRLTTTPEDTPEGFVREPGRRGLALAVEGLAQADGIRIAELRRGLPKNSVARRPYVRFDLEGDPNRRVVLVLPFDPSR